MNKEGIVAYSLGKELGFETGDKVMLVNGEDFRSFSDITSPDAILSDNGSYTVERNGQQIKLDIPSDFLDKFTDRRSEFINYRERFTVGEVSEEQGDAFQAGLKKGDKIVAVNGKEIEFFDEFRTELQANKSDKVTVSVERGADGMDLDIKVTDDGRLGFMVESTIQRSHQDFTFVESLGRGTNRAFNVVWVNIKAFGKMFKGDVSASKSLSGPIGIAKIFGDEFSWVKFWGITGLLSMVLAFMNLLPIPALDGGHVVFLTYEIVSGRKPSEKFMENAQKVGMVLLLGLMVFAFGNDIYKIVMEQLG